MLPKVVLWINALAWLGMGVWLSIDPVESLRGVHVTATAPAGATELRAMYGGLEFGLGLSLALAARKPAWHEPALWVAALTVGGLGSMRALSSVLAASSPMLWAFVALELTATALNIAAIRALVRQRNP